MILPNSYYKGTIGGYDIFATGQSGTLNNGFFYIVDCINGTIDAAKETIQELVMSKQVMQRNMVKKQK